MKTAMQEALERMELHYSTNYDVNWEQFKKKCIEKEKEQIINARDSKEIEDIEAWEFMKNELGGKSELNENIKLNYGRTAEEYYNQTYNQNK